MLYAPFLPPPLPPPTPPLLAEKHILSGMNEFEKYI